VLNQKAQNLLTLQLIKPLRLAGNVKAQGIPDLRVEPREELEGLVSGSFRSCKVNSDLNRENDGLGFLKKMNWLFFPMFHGLYCQRMVYHYKTDLLYLESLRQK
jgi:hypothetical protein